MIAEGATVTLSWRAQNASQVQIEGLGTYPPEGQTSVVLTQTTAFRVRAINPFGSIEALSDTVRVIALPRLRALSLVSFPAPAVRREPGSPTLVPSPSLKLGASPNLSLTTLSAIVPLRDATMPVASARTNRPADQERRRRA